MTSVDIFHHDVPAQRDFGYGVTRNQVISQTLYVVGLRQHATATAEGNLAYFGDHRPVSTVLGVPELTFPGQVIEIGFIVDTKLPA
ncbi:RidA family protein [Streptomyces rimosus]|uniref:hypothetical protein n=1 Tax=Streptomyces rimosus TaxID=1927 RepID=UPI000997D4D8|nr:hypothetical protein [Streptomyces rimosus]